MSPEQGKKGLKRIKSLFKECLTKIPSFLNACKASKESTSDMGDVLVHLSTAPKLVWILTKLFGSFEGDKDQAGIKLPSLFVDTI